MSLLCPKCMNPMRQYERNRVIVDQCTECGGLFLDRGELEALAAAERAYYGEPAGPSAGPPTSTPQAVQAPPPPTAPAFGYPPQQYQQPAPIYEDRRYDDRGYRDHGSGERRYDDRRPYNDSSYGKSKKRRARSFLEELFDD